LCTLLDNTDTNAFAIVRVCATDGRSDGRPGSGADGRVHGFFFQNGRDGHGPV
jgi:hypothetical protein